MDIIHSSIEKKPRKAQAMVEFALAMPILLLVVYGLLEVGRAIFYDAIVINAAREGARYGSASGTVSGAPQYADCAGIIAAVKSVDIINIINPSDIYITFDKGDEAPANYISDCAGLPQMYKDRPDYIGGYRITVQVSASFTPLTGLVPLSTHQFVSRDSRTLLGKVDVAGPGGGGSGGGGGGSGRPTLNVHIIGNGSVSSNPAGINCGSDCVESYDLGTIVVLTATKVSGYDFLGWSGGGCSGVLLTCTVTMDASKSVTANFESDPKLTVTKTGDGTGTIIINGTIVCDVTCAGYTQTYTIGTVLTIQAIPASGSTFGSATTDGWSGDCSGSGNCVVMIGTEKIATADFEASGAGTNKTLTINYSGLGTGTVTANSSSCTASCALIFPTGTVVNVSAVPNAPNIFIGYSGACNGTGPCSVTLDSSKTITVFFDTPSKLVQVTKTGGAAGTSSVTSTSPSHTPPYINCGGICSYSFTTGSSVTLHAVASAGATFTGWSGACSGTGDCSLAIDGPKLVRANFDDAGHKTLTVFKTGTGTGLITSNPAGIACGTICSFAFLTNQAVRLTASAGTNMTFDSWGGDCAFAGNSPTCDLTMGTAKYVTAQFTAVVLPPCTMVVFNPPTWKDSSKTVTWNFSNTYSGTEAGTPPEIDHIIVFWDGGNLTDIQLDGNSLWTGNQAPTTMSFDGGGRTVAYGTHNLVFSYPSPTSIKGYNFNATVYFKPQNCPIIGTGSWRVQ